MNAVSFDLELKLDLDIIKMINILAPVAQKLKPEHTDTQTFD